MTLVKRLPARRYFGRRRRNHDALRRTTRRYNDAIWIIGSGGHAKVAIDTARSSGEFDVIGCLDDDPGRSRPHILGVAVCGPVNEESFRNFRIDNAIIAIGSNAARQTYPRPSPIDLPGSQSYIARAYVAEGVALGAGTLVCAGAVIQPGVRIGSHSVVNTSASIDHDSTLGDFVTSPPGSPRGQCRRSAMGHSLVSVPA